MPHRNVSQERCFCDDYGRCWWCHEEDVRDYINGLKAENAELRAENARLMDQLAVLSVLKRQAEAAIGTKGDTI